MFASVTRVNRLFVVGNRDVGVEENRSVEFMDDLSILLKNWVLFFLFSLLHIFRSNFQSF